MKRILLFGTGRSSGTLIHYLHENANKRWELSICDNDKVRLEELGRSYPNIITHFLDIDQKSERQKIIAAHDLVISMLPAHLHIHIAKDALIENKHFLNASYVTPELYPIFKEGHKKGLIFMGELGLDPGLDHISAMKIIDEIRDQGGRITGFYSYAGGLVAKESDDNLWGYKFSWNPRNVVLAGRGTAQYKKDGQVRYIPYHRLFKAHQTLVIDQEELEWYPNRDSMSYISKYNLHACPTIIRGTLRRRNFCDAWQCFIDLGLTDDHSHLSNMSDVTYSEWIRGILKTEKDKNLDERLREYLNYPNGSSKWSKILAQLKETGILSDTKIGLDSATPAQILQKLLESKWALKSSEKDQIVMLHEILFEKNNQSRIHRSVLRLDGKNSDQTAMSKLVGLPLAIMSEMVITGEISSVNNTIPIKPEIYLAILNKLEGMGIKFNERIDKID